MLKYFLIPILLNIYISINEKADCDDICPRSHKWNLLNFLVKHPRILSPECKENELGKEFTDFKKSEKGFLNI